MSPAGITLLMLAGFAGFGWLAWRKLAIVAALQPEVRWDHPAARLKAVLVNGFLQQRMIARDWKPGLMHAVIFLGFMALLVRKLQLIAIGYHEPFVYPGLAGGLFAGLKDIVELAVLGALAYAFWRRYVLRPQRLEKNREALLVLVLITVIMVTDLLYDGFRFALFSAADAGIAHERDFAFAGSALASTFAGWPQGTLQAGYELSYWVQLATVFGFLVLLPTGEHFHIVTALPALFFRRGGPTNVVPAVDLEKMMSDDADAGELRVGVHTARDLSWKDGLDVFTCTECGRCKDACPTYLTGKPLSLKWVNDSLKHHLLEQRETLLAPPPKADAAAADDPLPPLVGSVIGEDTLWACTTCGYCEAACPIELEHLSKFYKLRQHRVMMDGEFPHELKPVFEAYESQSNPWGLPSQTRADWASDLNLPRLTDVAQAAEFDMLFYVGSAQSFDPRGQKIARAFVAILQAAGVRFAILGDAETSTGECVRRAGNEMLFQQLATTLVGTLNGLGVKRIVTCDPHAFNSLKNEYPAFGGHYDLEHHTQTIARLLSERRITLAPSFERVVFHDPCYLGRHNGEYEAPRQVIGRLAKDAPLEFALQREKAMCCGAGGARMWLEETIGTRINVARTEQALELAPKVIATACPYCAVMIGDGLKTLGREAEVASKDIAELVAEALVRPAPH
ncbi:MAG: (Fe-S)-binding protein [Betaproteobacteria bacterium]|jgi:Fe-S oxidoreductase|nr:(Fe-S)-binding protein [Betaproteobacteria bacterium]MBK7514346.1 (Fe-S)-binding protein [Betaproteobacteria bacterium]MBL0295684.1 (Fe-S)-binding protein [Betaproteobacteria bacterium]